MYLDIAVIIRFEVDAISNIHDALLVIITSIIIIIITGLPVSIAEDSAIGS